MSEKNSMIIAESQFLIAFGLKALISENELFKTPLIANTECELTNLFRQQTPNIILINPSIFIKSENNYLCELRIKHPDIKILILANTLNRTDIQKYNTIGIENIIYKSAEKDEILDAIAATIKGKKYYSSEVLDALLSNEKNKANLLILLLLQLLREKL